MMDMQVDGKTWNEGFRRRHDVELAHQQKTKITGKWFAVVYKGKQKTTFFIAKINQWFLDDIAPPLKLELG